MGLTASGEICIADNHNNFNLTVFSQAGQLLGALESKVLTFTPDIFLVLTDLFFLGKACPVLRRGPDEGRLHRAGLQGLQAVHLSLCQDPKPLSPLSLNSGWRGSILYLLLVSYYLFSERGGSPLTYIGYSFLFSKTSNVLSNLPQ